jgi:hypothetical protein
MPRFPHISRFAPAVRLAPRLSLVLSLVLSIVLLAALTTPAAFAHVTPNVELVKRGVFIRDALPGASQFFERKLDLGDADRAAIRQAVDWIPSVDDTKVYVGRDADGALVGTAIFVWTPSQHGPVSIGVVFDPKGAILRVTVTEVGSEPLSWVQPLVEGNGMTAFEGLALDQAPDPSRVAPEVRGKLSRYYAEVIAEGVRRAQAVEKVAAPGAEGSS